MDVARVGEPLVLKSGDMVPLVPATKTSDLIFLSGQLGFDSEGNLAKGIAIQTLYCLENAEKILLKAGSNRDKIVRVAAWLVNSDDFQEFNSVYSEFFNGIFPARTTIRSDLVLKDALVEIEVTAVY